MAKQISIEAQILVAIVGTLAGIWLWNQYAEFRAQRAAQQVMDTLSAQAAQITQQVNGQMAQAQHYAQEQAEEAHAQQAARDRYEQLIANDDMRSRLLAQNQRCVGGEVIQVDGSTYTQLGSISNPVHCSGQYADRAIR